MTETTAKAEQTTYAAHTVNTDHKDLIHDVDYDFYGKRMATCSSDQSVKVWDEDERGNWKCTANWKAHSGSVWKVTWAHPEYGQVIATCSFDRTAAVWEEIVSAEMSSSDRSPTHWIKRTSLVDARTSVTDVKFAPKHHGLLLATCSAEGIVRIYEAPDVMNLSQWSLQHEINCKVSLSCLSWNPSLCRLHPPMIVVGSDDNNTSSGSKVFVYEYSENSRRWSKVESFAFVTDSVHDIAFAPNVGRSFHLLGIATSKDLRIVTMKPLQWETVDVQSNYSRFETHTVGQFSDHNSTVWRVAWNVGGTVLASSGDDGFVRLWKGNYLESWKSIGVLKSDGTYVSPDVVAATAEPSQSSSLAGGSNSTARYYKLGTINNPTQVPGH